MREFRRLDLAAEDLPRLGSVLRHFKGEYYKITGTAHYTDAERDDLVQVLLYRRYGERSRHSYARPFDEFLHEVKDNSGRWVRRFEVISYRISEDEL